MGDLEFRALRATVNSTRVAVEGVGKVEEIPGLYDPTRWPAVFWAWRAAHDGKTYVVVGIDPVASTPGNEVLAVYLVDPLAGLRRPKLRRLDRWPKAIEDPPTGDQMERWDRRH